MIQPDWLYDYVLKYIIMLLTKKVVTSDNKSQLFMNTVKLCKEKYFEKYDILQRKFNDGRTKSQTI